jgi:hypothetical protein
MTLNGTGSGHYDTGNTVGTGSSAGTTSLPPGSPAAVFAEKNKVNLSDPTNFKQDPTSGAYAMKDPNGTWNLFSQSGQPATSIWTQGPDGQASTLVQGDSSKSIPNVWGNIDNQGNFSWSTKPTDLSASAQANSRLSSTLNGANGETNIQSSTNKDGFVLVAYDKGGQAYHAVFDSTGNFLGDATADQNISMKIKNPGTGQGQYFNWDASSNAYSSSNSALTGGSTYSVSGDGSGGYSNTSSPSSAPSSSTPTGPSDNSTGQSMAK